ncbi:HET-domain-containing protein, partial [Coniophora puteana RWD-64-598 SS2]
MNLVDRAFVRSYYQEAIQNITEQEADIWGPTPHLVTGLVKSKARYAILSHRWGADEPTYLDLSTPARLAQLEDEQPQGPGYSKLKNFCREARKHGMVFGWSDTCCIDKSSSAELDESIRSMFRWYRNAELCLVHLAQTRGLHEVHRDPWFRLGWTLQELLAPRRIKFFAADWVVLTVEENDKAVNASLLEPLERATGIREVDLRNFAPDPFDVDIRMTWAAQRVTTRAEDAAYALMGMFDVSIQIAYGEGADRAFARVVEAIMLAGGSPTVLNWAGPAA